MRWIGFVFCGFLSVSCVENSVVKQEKELRIEAALRSDKHLELGDLTDSIDCVLLETTDSSLLANRSYLLYGDEKDLFVRSGDQLFRFRADGRFLNKIGEVGNGPGEYKLLYSVSVDPKEERLVFYVGQRRVQFWNYAGRLEKELTLSGKGEITNVQLLGQDKLVAEQRLYSDKGVETTIQLFDLSGKCVKEIPIHRDEESVNRTMMTVPLMYSREGNVKYKDIHEKSLYAFSGTDGAVEWTFELGEYAPSRELLEDVNKKETLLREFAQLVDVRESENCFYLLMVYAKTLRGMIVDKKTGAVLFSESIAMPQRGGGLKNNFIQNTAFWPTYISDQNVAYALLSVDRLSPTEKEELRTFLSPSNLPIPEDSNPVVIKAYVK